jgi:cystathionine beta-lyase/cystathionine gamma-synthase
VAELPGTPARLGTRAVHVARSGPTLGPVGEVAHTPPLFQSANFVYPDADAADRAAAGGAYLYTRHGNPTTDALADAVADLEGAEAALTFSSGMAAVAAAVFAYGTGGEILASEGLYGGSIELLAQLGPRHGIRARFVPTWDLNAVERAIGPDTRALLVETISNPLLRVADVSGLSALAQKHGLVLLVDGTFSSPVLSRPLGSGATLVIHSVSKYIGGHGDLVGGVAAGSRSAIASLRPYLVLLGGSMDPFCAWLALRGLRTLPLRMERASATAARLANFLARQPGIARVHYPGNPDHPDHALAARVLDAPGAMISFEVSDGVVARRIYDSFRYFVRAASLGEVSSLVTHPASFSHKGVPADERARLGIGEGLLRLSVGIEDAADLEADLAHALAVAA